MTQEELDEFKLKSRKDYKKVNQDIKNKCTKCRNEFTGYKTKVDYGEPNCKKCKFDFSKFLMRSILPEKDGICRKCSKWLTDECYNQGNKDKQCDDMNLMSGHLFKTDEHKFTFRC